MSDQLEDPHNSHHTDQPDDFSCLPHNGKIFDALEQNCKEQRDDGQKVNEIHRLKEEPHLLRAAEEPHEILEGEVDGAGIVHELDGIGQLGILGGTRLLINLKE